MIKSLDMNKSDGVSKNLDDAKKSLEAAMGLLSEDDSLRATLGGINTQLDNAILELKRKPPAVAPQPLPGPQQTPPWGQRRPQTRGGVAKRRLR